MSSQYRHFLQDMLEFCSEVMGPLNAAINFFLYNLMSRRFRREFLRLLRQTQLCGCCGEDGEDISRSEGSNRVPSVSLETFRGTVAIEGAA
jgi:hypothetical protein